MPFQPVTNGAETIIKGQLDDEDAFITLGWSAAPGWTAGQLANLVAALEAWFQTTLMGELPVAYVYRETVGRDLRSASGFEATSAVNTGTTGTLTGESAPNNVTLAVSFRTGLIGRSNRGRNYIPGIRESDVFGNEVSQTRINGYIAAYTQLVGDGSLEADWIWGVISRTTGGALRPAGVVIPIVAVTVTDNIVDSQRRRLPGRGD